MKKLIRDHIPGVTSDMYIEVDKKTAYEYLVKKLDEEIQELKDSDFKDVNEYGDVLEILYSIAKYNKLTQKDIEVARSIKFKERGGFSNKILK